MIRRNTCGSKVTLTHRVMYTGVLCGRSGSCRHFQTNSSVCRAPPITRSDTRLNGSLSEPTGAMTWHSSSHRRGHNKICRGTMSAAGYFCPAGCTWNNRRTRRVVIPGHQSAIDDRQRSCHRHSAGSVCRQFVARPRRPSRSVRPLLGPLRQRFLSFGQPPSRHSRCPAQCTLPLRRLRARRSRMSPGDCSAP